MRTNLRSTPYSPSPCHILDAAPDAGERGVTLRVVGLGLGATACFYTRLEAAVCFYTSLDAVAAPASAPADVPSLGTTAQHVDDITGGWGWGLRWEGSTTV